MHVPGSVNGPYFPTSHKEHDVLPLSGVVSPLMTFADLKFGDVFVPHCKHFVAFWSGCAHPVGQSEHAPALP